MNTGWAPAHFAALDREPPVAPPSKHGCRQKQRLNMWYIMDNMRFFLMNVIATTAILTGLTFGIPPLINWLTRKLHQDED